MPAKQVSGRSSLIANQTTSFFFVSGFGSGAYSAKLLNGTRQRLSGFSQPRQCGDEVLRIFVSRAIADRLVSNRMRKQFNQANREFIETSSFSFLATATPQSVDCSFKGGDPGFVRVIGENVVAWPDPGAPRFDAQSP